MEPTKLPVVNQGTVDQAFQDKLESSGLAVGSVTAVTVANYFLNAPFGPVVQGLTKFGITGLEAKPGPAGRGEIKVPKLAVAMIPLPQPVGYVPAETYNLHPEFYKQQLGFPVGSKPPFFSATEARIKVFEAREAANEIGRRALGQNGPHKGPPDLTASTIPPGKINVTLRELQFLQSLPPGTSEVQRLLPQLEARKTDLSNYFPPHTPLTPAQVAQSLGISEAEVLRRVTLGGGAHAAWYAPESYGSVNQKAIDNRDGDGNGRLMLAADREDP